LLFNGSTPFLRFCRRCLVHDSSSWTQINVSTKPIIFELLTLSNRR
jgi:hypothetical protein